MDSSGYVETGSLEYLSTAIAQGVSVRVHIPDEDMVMEANVLPAGSSAAICGHSRALPYHMNGSLEVVRVFPVLTTSSIITGSKEVVCRLSSWL